MLEESHDSLDSRAKLGGRVFELKPVLIQLGRQPLDLDRLLTGVGRQLKAAAGYAPIRAPGAERRAGQKDDPDANTGDGDGR